MGARDTRIAISLPAQLLILASRCIDWIYYAVTVCAIIYKAVKWPYPTSVLAWECTSLSLLCVIEAVRLTLGTRGNRTQSSRVTALFAVLCLPCIVAHVYFARYQTYVLRVDQVVNIIALIPLCLSTLLAPVAAVAFARRQYF